jgi:toxin ParE1/3/4
MSWRLHTRPEAEHDIAAARDWYDGVQAGLGDPFLDDLSAAIQQLANHPQVPRIYYRNFRRTLLHRFPYKVFYQVIGPQIVISRVLHVRQCHDSALSE